MQYIYTYTSIINTTYDCSLYSHLQQQSIGH